jgi:glycosyltransferase involved in cell wall biosynthesis
MRDAAVKFAERGWLVDFVTVRPRVAFASGGGHATMAELVPTATTLRVSAPTVGTAFELGTEGYRSAVYQSSLLTAVREGTPIIVSNDAAAWHAAAGLTQRNPPIGVLHADEDAYYQLATRHARDVSALVCVSDRIARETRARLGPSSPPVSVIPCGITLRPFAAEADERSGTRLVWVGRIEQRQKRVLDLPAIVQRVALRDGNVSLTIIGDGPDKAALRTAMAGVSEVRVRWLGWLDAARVREELSDSDILLLPSAFEGMPLVVMEALAEGCAVVSSRVSGVEDLARHPLATNCLWTHAPGDVVDASELVRRAQRVPRSVRRVAARQLAEAECSLRVCVDRYEQLVAMLQRGDGNRGGIGRLTHLGVRVISLPIALLRQARRWMAGARA